jgi:hypothetical protein
LLSDTPNGCPSPCSRPILTHITYKTIRKTTLLYITDNRRKDIRFLMVRNVNHFAKINIFNSTWNTSLIPICYCLSQVATSTSREMFICSESNYNAETTIN